MSSRRNVIRRTVALGVVASLFTSGCTGGASSGTAAPTPTSGSAGNSTGGAASSAPTCAPRVVDSGYRKGGVALFDYGVVVENPCDRPAISTVVNVVLLDKDGKDLPRQEPGNNVTLPAILPGQRLGVGGGATKPNEDGELAQTPVSLAFRITPGSLVDRDAFAAWPKSATASAFTLGTPGGAATPVTFHVVTDPPGAALCDPVAYMIIRDGQGKIVAGYGRFEPVASPGTFSFRTKLRLDPATTEFSIVQGRNGATTAAAIACR